MALEFVCKSFPSSMTHRNLLKSAHTISIIFDFPRAFFRRNPPVCVWLSWKKQWQTVVLIIGVLILAKNVKSEPLIRRCCECLSPAVSPSKLFFISFVKWALIAGYVGMEWHPNIERINVLNTMGSHVKCAYLYMRGMLGLQHISLSNFLARVVF